MDNDGWLNGFRVQALSSKKKEGSSWHFRTGKETQHRLDVLQFHVLSGSPWLKGKQTSMI